MSNIDKQALREAAQKALQAMNRLLMIPDDELFDDSSLNVDDDVGAVNAFNLLAGPETMLALLDELEAAERRNVELTEALRHSVIGYKSCLHMGYDRIIELGGDCDAPEVMIAGNPDIQQAEKLLATGIGKGE
ncbi:ead/Ea22-like family protein [Trabulsiella odontotermitis]|uniref:ead/Ea22-like family protein n=1 Tax=Trabulsiella odontotermitis TaxID=379893 RepID=UPI00067674AE|nr:ead/Ea22-like family protein [Trabulsiella odontotermitis]